MENPKSYVSHGRRDCDRVLHNRANAHGAHCFVPTVPTVKVEPELNNNVSTSEINKEFQSSNMNYIKRERDEMDYSSRPNKIFKADYISETCNQENIPPLFKFEGAECKDSKPVHSSLGTQHTTRSDVIRNMEDYFYLESRYLNFSESGEKFACTLCPTVYLSHGAMLAHLLESNHMNILWSSKQTSITVIEKIQKLSCLIPFMRKGVSSIFSTYNPLTVFRAFKNLEVLLHKLVKKGSPCCPIKLRQAWYLCDCVMDTTAEDGQLPNYVSRQKVNFIKSGECLPGATPKTKLDVVMKSFLEMNCNVNLKNES